MNQVNLLRQTLKPLLLLWEMLEKKAEATPRRRKASPRHLKFPQMLVTDAQGNAPQAGNSNSDERMDLLDRLRQKGKHLMAILGALMRKLLHIVYGVLKTGKPFDPDYGLIS